MSERLNLIPAFHLLARKRARRVQTWLLGCGVYSLATVVVVIGMQVALAAEPGDLQRGLVDVSHMREKMQAQLDHLTGERTRLTQQYAAARAVGLQPDWSVALRLLGSGGAEGIVLTRLEMSPTVATDARGSLLAEVERYRIIVEGLAVSEQALAHMIRAVERVGPFSRVRREASAMEEFGDQEAVRFRLVCEIGQAARDEGSAAAGKGVK